jgi:hypothetical protein
VGFQNSERLRFGAHAGVWSPEGLVLLSIVHAIFRVVLEALVSGKHRDRDVELLVLRHQLMVL